MNKKNKLVIGLTGPNAVGKGEVCKYLAKKGFLIMSLSDILREEAYSRGLEPTRDNLIILGNELRTKFGSEILAKQLLKEIMKQSCVETLQSGTQKDMIVIDSIRTVGEVEQFKKVFKKKFILINLSAPKLLRFRFMQRRGRKGDPTSFSEFLKTEKKECSNNPVKQQIHKCRKLSDYFINNNATLHKLHQKIDKVLKEVLKNY